MAGRVPQNGRYFQFLWMAPLFRVHLSSLSDPFFSPWLPPDPALFRLSRSSLASHIIAPSSPSSPSPLLCAWALPPPPFHPAICSRSSLLPPPHPHFSPFSNVLLESDSIFALAVLSYGEVIFHNPILERGENMGNTREEGGGGDGRDGKSGREWVAGGYARNNTELSVRAHLICNCQTARAGMLRSCREKSAASLSIQRSYARTQEWRISETNG